MSPRKKSATAVDTYTCLRPECESTDFLPGNATVKVMPGNPPAEIDSGRFYFCARCGQPCTITGRGQHATVIGHREGLALRVAQQQRADEPPRTAPAPSGPRARLGPRLKGDLEELMS